MGWPAIEAGKGAKDKEHAISQMGQSRRFERAPAISAVYNLTPDISLHRNNRRDGPNKETITSNRIDRDQSFVP
jgi:hypothetical protein